MGQGPLYRYKTTSEASKKENEEVKAKEIWGGFKEQTTAHGIPHVDQARGTTHLHDVIEFFKMLNKFLCDFFRLLQSSVLVGNFSHLSGGFDLAFGHHYRHFPPIQCKQERFVYVISIAMFVGLKLLMLLS